MRETEKRQLLAILDRNWPDAWKTGAASAGTVQAEGHPLASQLEALLADRAASLPWFATTEIVWCTLAPDSESLLDAVEDLRAWIVPSFGWEDGTRTPNPSDTRAGSLRALIATLSPAGYFRWKTHRAQLHVVVEKLNARSWLTALKPRHVFEAPSSLIELRRRFETALVAGDRDSGEDAIRAIDHRGLDTATNTQFMRIRLWDHFREYARLATEPRVTELVRVRMPHAVRLAIVRGFHNHFLAPLEANDDIEGAKAVYAKVVHPAIGSLLVVCRPSDGPEIHRCLAYRAAYLGDNSQAAPLSANSTDDMVTRLLQPLAAVQSLSTETTHAVPSLRSRVRDAVAKGDVRAIQDIGEEVLRTDKQAGFAQEDLVALLRRSLEEHANPRLAKLLAGVVSAPRGSSVGEVVPSTWTEAVAALRVHRWSLVSTFLNVQGSGSIAELPAGEVIELLDVLEELATDPALDRDGLAQSTVSAVLLRVIHDLRTEFDFPQTRHAEVFPRLLRMWTEHRKGSAHREDRALFLLLADAVLQLNAAHETDVIDHVRLWWETRRSSVLLGFLLEVLSLLSPYEATRIACEGLWLEAADLIRRRPDELTRGERQAWCAIGSRLGIDITTIDQFLAIDRTVEDAPDLIAEARLSKVAIVTRRLRSAEEAARQIRARSEAQVLVVTDKDAGAATDRAKAADVILIVWSTISHAVYRAFDRVRDKIIYVQGTGAESIILALERALLQRLEKFSA